MTVSDSNPIQFWPVDEETYNEKAICGVYKECYCQKFNCDDTIKTQIHAPDGGQFELRSYDEDSVLCDTIDFDLVDNNVVDAIYIPNGEPIENGRATGGNGFDSVIQNYAQSSGVGAGSFDAINKAISEYKNTDVNVAVTVNSSDLTGSVFLNFILYNSAKSQSTNIPSVPVTYNGVYELSKASTSFNPAYFEVLLDNGTAGNVDWSIEVTYCYKKTRQFKIYDNSEIGALAGFTNRVHSFISGGSNNWSLGSNPSITLGGTSISSLAIENFPTFANQTYTIEYSANFGTNGANLYIILLDENYNLTHVLPSIPESSTGETTGTVEITPTSDGSFIAFFLENGGVVNTFTMHTLEKLSPTEIELYHSDCVEFKEDHECTELITYYNSKNFDGLVFETVGSPSPGSFSLRVPAQFYQESNPQEVEDHEKSNGEIVTLRQTIQSKRLLEIGYVPAYMHRKIQKILMMSSVYIDGKYWKKRDSYDDNTIKKYTLKQASVWLTEYNSVKKNTL